MMKSVGIGLTLIGLMLTFGAAPAYLQDDDQEYSGYLDQTVTEKDYAITLAAGDSVLITAEPVDGNLDTVLTLKAPDGGVVAENDDRDRDTLGSAVGFTAPEAGTYTVTVSRYEFSDNSGRYELSIQIGDMTLLQGLDNTSRLELSGPEEWRDTEHFRIHYTLEGDDATTEQYISAMAISAEEIWSIEVDRMGWPPPPPDGLRGGNDKFDIYVANVLGTRDFALGYSSPEDRIGDNPYTPEVEETSMTSYVVIENDFVDRFYFNTTDPTSLMRTTLVHEFHHAIQFGYQVDELLWYYESSATWMETAALVKDEDATGFVEDVFKFPEICFGAETHVADGLLVYGQWLFLQAMVDEFDEGVVKKLWENIAEHRGFSALDETLKSYGSDVPTMLAQYHVRNLIRRYELATEFDATVWVENTIDDLGTWTFTGDGVQELAANYFVVALSPGAYQVDLVNDDERLLLWAVGVRGDEADAIELGRGGVITNDGYDYVYLIVFNPTYDDNPSRCEYRDYDVEIGAAGTNQPAPVTRIWDATYFEPLR